ncbi:uncharacterized protein LOC144453544 isoform X2 [Glandiceps talaboti]
MDTDNGNTEENCDTTLIHVLQDTSKVEGIPQQESSMEISPTLMDLYDTLASTDYQTINGNDQQSTNQVIPDDTPTNQKSDDHQSTNHNADTNIRPISSISTSSTSSMDSQSSKSYTVSSPEDDNKKFEEKTLQKESSSESVTSTSKDRTGQEKLASSTEDDVKSLQNQEEMITKSILTESHCENTDNRELDGTNEVNSKEKVDSDEELITKNDSEVMTDNKSGNEKVEKTANFTEAKNTSVQSNKTGESTETDPRKVRKSSRINPPLPVDPTSTINGAASPPASPPLKSKHHKHKQNIQDNSLYINRVVSEIIETERKYVEDMHDIIEGYLELILDKPELPISPENFNALFGNIEEIYNFNKGLLDELESCDSDPISVAECFVDKDSEFKVYTQYCTNYPSSVAVLMELSESREMMEFFKGRQIALLQPLPLGSYLLKPVQRILKYRLLFQEIHRHFNKKADGFDVIEEALATMTRIAKYINDMKRKHETAVHVQEIQSQLHGWDESLISYGDLVLEDVFRMAGARADRFVFLFEKALLIGKRREDGLISIKAIIMCNNMVLQEVVQRDTLWFVIIPFDNNKIQYVIQARSMEQKRLWTHELKRLIIENHPSVVPIHAKQVILDQDRDRYYASDDSAELLDKKDHPRNKEERRSKRNPRYKSDPTARKLKRGSVQLKGMKKPDIISPRSSMKKSRHQSGHSSTEMDTQSESESPIKRRASLQTTSLGLKFSDKSSKDKKMSKEEAVRKSGSLTRSDSLKSKSLDSLAAPKEKSSPSKSSKHYGGDDASPRAQRLSRKLEVTEINTRDSVGWSEDLVEAVEAVFDKLRKDEDTSTDAASSANSSRERLDQSHGSSKTSNSGLEQKGNSNKSDNSKSVNQHDDRAHKPKITSRRKSLPRNDSIIEEESAPLAAGEEDFETSHIAAQIEGKGSVEVGIAATTSTDDIAGKHVDAYTVPRRRPTGTQVPSNYRSSTSVLEQVSLRNSIFKIKRTDKIKQYAEQSKKSMEDSEDIWVKRTDAGSSQQTILAHSQSVTTMYSTHYSQDYSDSSHLPKHAVSQLIIPKSGMGSPVAKSPKSPQSARSPEVSPSKETMIDSEFPLPTPPPVKETLIGAEESETVMSLLEEQSKHHHIHSSDDILAATIAASTRIPISRSLSDSTKSQPNLGTGSQPNLATGSQPNLATESQPNLATESQPNLATETKQQEEIQVNVTSDKNIGGVKKLSAEAEEIVDDLEKYMAANSKRSKKSVPSFPASANSSQKEQQQQQQQQQQKQQQKQEHSASSSQTDIRVDSTSSSESLSDNIKHMLQNLGSRLTGHKTPSPGPSPRSSQYLEQISISSDEAKSPSYTKSSPPSTPEKEQKPPKVYMLARAYSQRLKHKASKSFIKKRTVSDSGVDTEESYEQRLASLLGGENAQGGASIGARYAKQGDTMNRNLKLSWSEPTTIITESEFESAFKDSSPVFSRIPDTVLLRQKPERDEEEEEEEEEGDEDMIARRKSVRESISTFEEIMKAMSSPTIPRSLSSRTKELLEQESDFPDLPFKSIKERRMELEKCTSKTVTKTRALSEFYDGSDASSVCSLDSEGRNSRHGSNTTSPLHTPQTSPLHTRVGKSLQDIREDDAVSVHSSRSRTTSGSEDGELMPVIMKSIKERFRELQEAMDRPIPRRNAKEEIEEQRKAAEGADPDDVSESQGDIEVFTAASESMESFQQTDDKHNAESTSESTHGSANEVDDDDEKYQLGGESESDSENNSDSEYETPIGSMENIPDVLNTLDNLDTLEDLPAEITDDESIEDEATLEADDFIENYLQTPSVAIPVKSSSHDRTTVTIENTGQSESET